LAGSALEGLFDTKTEVFKGITYLFIIGIITFSLYPKYVFNSQPWGSARFTTPDEYNMAGFLYNITSGTKVLDACMYERVWGLNLWDDPLDVYMLGLKNNKANISEYGWDSEGWLTMVKENSPLYTYNSTDLSNDLLRRDYKYAIFGSKCMKVWGIDRITLGMRMGELTSSGKFKTAFKSEDEYVLEVIKDGN
jgi:hypothetical protein